MQRLICKPSAFSRAADSYDANARVQKELANALLERFLSLPKAPVAGTVFEVGCGTGEAARQVVLRMAPKRLIVNDVAPGMLAKTLEGLSVAAEEADVRVTALSGDAETMNWPIELDAVLSFSAVQWFKNPLGVLDRAYSALNDGGVVAVSTFLPGTACEVTDFTGCALAYPEEAAWQEAMANGFDVEHFVVSTHRLICESPLAVLRHLQATGAAGSASGFRWNTAKLAQFDRHCRSAHPAPGGGVCLTFRALQFIARKRGLSHGT